MIRKIFAGTWLCGHFMVHAAGPVSVPVGSPIPDGNPAGVTSQVAVENFGGALGEVRVNLDIGSRYGDDLLVSLSHGGKTAVLWDAAAQPQRWQLQRRHATASERTILRPQETWLPTSLGDDSEVVYRNMFQRGRNRPVQSPPFTSDLVAHQPLSAVSTAFAGSDPNGEWTLFIADVHGGNAHTLANWELDLGTSCWDMNDEGYAVVPEARGWGLLAGLALLGVVATQLRLSVCRAR